MLENIALVVGEEGTFLADAGMKGYGKVLSCEASLKKGCMYKVKDGCFVFHDMELLREMMEREKGQFFLLSHAAKKDFMHQRNAGLNQVFCAIAKKRQHTFIFDIHELEHDKAIGRVMQNLRLAKKYGVPVVFTSFPKEKMQLKSFHDLTALHRVLLQ